MYHSGVEAWVQRRGTGHCSWSLWDFPGLLVWSWTGIPTLTGFLTEKAGRRVNLVVRSATG